MEVDVGVERIGEVVMGLLDVRELRGQDKRVMEWEE